MKSEKKTKTKRMERGGVREKERIKRKKKKVGNSKIRNYGLRLYFAEVSQVVKK